MQTTTSSDLRANVATTIQETITRPFLSRSDTTGNSLVIPDHGLPTCDQCGRPIRNAQRTTTRLCSARCIDVDRHSVFAQEVLP